MASPKSGRFAAFLILALAAFGGPAAAQPVSEPAVKAAFLYKFVGYVDWPAQALPPETPYVIGTLGGDEVASELERIVASRAINGRRVTVRRLREGEPIRNVHVLFIGRAQPGTREALQAVQRSPVLTVTEMQNGLEQGGVVNLVTLEDHVGFEVSLEAAERAGLGISSRMLAVARRVSGKGGGAG